VDINYLQQPVGCSSPMDESPSSSPVPFQSSSPSSSEDECFPFPDQTFLPQLSDLPMELLEKRSSHHDGLSFDTDGDIFFSNYTMNFSAQIAPPSSSVRPLSRYSSNENCPVISSIQVISDCHSIKHEQEIKSELNSVPPPPPKSKGMSKFVSESVVDFKHVIYNLLVDNYNSPCENNFVQPISLEVLPGVFKQGFKFNEKGNPEKRLPELYAQHIRKADLKLENQNSVFIQDLYKFYLRACLELLSKYFVKYEKYTFLYDDIVLFIAGGPIEEAEKRISKMGTIQRRHKRNKNDDFPAIKKAASKIKRVASDTDHDRKKRSKC